MRTPFWIYKLWKLRFPNKATKKKLEGWLDWQERTYSNDISKEEIEKSVSSVWQRIAPPLSIANAVPNRKKWISVAAAAAILGVCVFLGLRQYMSTSTAIAAIVQPAQAGGLMKISGKTIQIDSSLNGQSLMKDSLVNFAYAENRVIINAKSSYNNKYVSEGELITPFQHVLDIDLGDKLSIKLNSGSTLHYKIFAGTKRIQFCIEGEGYFNVKKHQNLDLEVTANQYHIKDIGTQFNILNYSSDSALSITVRKGAVSVSNVGNLKGDETYLISKNTAVSKWEKLSNKSDYEMAWVDGMFRFKNIKLSDLLQKMARWYNIKYTFKDPISTNSFSGSFPMTLTLNDVVQILNSTNKMKIKQNGKTLIISHY